MKTTYNRSSKFILLYIIVSINAIFTSCKKEHVNKNNDQGTVTFSFQNETVSNLKSTFDYPMDSVDALVVSIKDQNNNYLYTNQVIKLVKLNGQFISSPLQLKPGDYRLSAFMLIDKNENVLFITPMKNSKYAYLVKNPLEIEFSVIKNETTNVVPEVISTNGYKPKEFGYAFFSFVQVKTFDLAISVFSSNGGSVAFTRSFVTIINDADTVYRDSLYAIPNKIRLPERNGDYQFIIAKDGYPNLSETFTIDSLKSHSNNNNPLIFTFNKSMSHGLVFWNKMGSVQEILHSEVGPNLSFYDPALDGTTNCCDVIGVLSFVPGKFGNALTVGPSNNYYQYCRVHMVTLRDQDAVLDYNHGCIELWYYQNADPLANYHWYRLWNGSFGVDANLGFWVTDPAEIGYLFIFGMRTDMSNGIAITYNPGNGVRNNHNLNNRWIHLAIVWDKAGIDKSDNAMEMFVDGKMVASGKQNNWSKLINGSQEISGGTGNTLPSTFYMDNLKVWNYAKTDFSDRFSE